MYNPQLETFIRVADAGSFNKAAEQSYIYRCESSNDVLMAVRTWASVHPLLKIIPVEWDHFIPYGLLHSRTPSETVQRFLSAIQTVLHQ